MQTETTRADRLFALFGGATRLAREIGVHKAVLTRWKGDGPRGLNGRVPIEYNERIMEAAERCKVSREALRECLDMRCPTCGQAL